MGFVPDTTSDRPLRISIIPSVAMKGGIFIRDTSVPETKPQSAPMPMAPTSPRGRGRPQ